MTKKALVLGAGGFVAHHLVKQLKREDFFVTGADLVVPAYEKSDADEFYRCDLGEVCLRQLVAQKTYFNECQMPSSNLAEADLSHCVFANSSLAKVCMDDCELAGVDFSSSDVLTASFRNASFEQSIGFSEIKSSRIRSLEVA